MGEQEKQEMEENAAIQEKGREARTRKEVGRGRRWERMVRVREKAIGLGE